MAESGARERRRLDLVRLRRDPGVTEEERGVVLDLIAKGGYTAITLASDDLDGAFEKIQASGADVLQEPTDQPYGVRDCAFRDPAGNLVRINQRA